MSVSVPKDVLEISMYTGRELVEAVNVAARAMTDSVVRVDIDRKKKPHLWDPLISIFYSAWMSCIISACQSGMQECVLEHTTRGIKGEAEETARQRMQDEIANLFVDTGFKVLKFYNWRHGDAAHSVSFGVSWRRRQ